MSPEDPRRGPSQKENVSRRDMNKGKSRTYKDEVKERNGNAIPLYLSKKKRTICI